LPPICMLLWLTAPSFKISSL